MNLDIIEKVFEILSVTLIAYWSYNQYTKNKMTDKKIEEFKNVEKRKLLERNDSISKIYFDLYRILIDLKADRVYILQPHPLINNHYVSVGFEVKEKGVNEIKPYIQNVAIQELPNVINKIAKRDWIIHRDIETEVEDKRVKSFLKGFGTTTLFIRKMSTEKDGWVGSIIVDFMEKTETPIDYAKAVILEASETIQYILPEMPDYNEKKK